MKRKVALIIAAVSAATLILCICLAANGGNNESQTENSSTLTEEKAPLPPYIPTEFESSSLYLEGKSLCAAVFESEISEERLRYYNSIGIDFVIVPNEETASMAAKYAKNYTVSIILEQNSGENAAAALKNEDIGGVFFRTSVDAATAAFLSKQSGKAVFCTENGESVLCTEGEITPFLSVDTDGLEKTESLLALYESAKNSEKGGVIFSQSNRIFQNENAFGDAVASLFNPSRRYDMTALTVGIPSSRSFSVNYSNVWLMGGSDPNYPLYLNGKEVARTANGLFSVKAELAFGENVLTLTNGERELVFKVKCGAKSASLDNKKSDGTAPEIGKVAVIDGTLCPLLFASVPIKSNESSVYAPNGITDVITEKLSVKNHLNGKTLEVYRLECGYYVETKYATVTEEEKPRERALLSADLSLDENWLTLTVKTEGAPFFSVKDGEKAEITFLGDLITDGLKLAPLPKNVIFSSASVNIEEGKVVFELSLNEGASLLGWDASYDGDTAIIKFRLPKRLKEGSKPLSDITVMLDAGHSSYYGGTQGPDYPNDLKERVLTYNTASLCRKYLEELGATVILSRDDKTDKILYASEVKTWYHQNGADIGVSVHFNALSATANSLSRSGVLTIYSNAHSKQLSDILAQNTAAYAKRNFKGSGKSDYIICHVPYLPSVIIECGYLTNIFEYDWFLKPENVDCFAKAMATAIYDYFVWQDSMYK
ncbi:MAG: N-acetylmuramoyl-L-alanine amidase [Clostridia bacterium]|nr:N-acetylmuramoyl-L-alanine amidase [Clostridia bacterium]